MNEVGRKLLDAHVAHELARLSGPSFAALVDARVADLFDWFANVTLTDVANPNDIATSVEGYVIDLRVSGGITELAGEMAHLVLASSANTRAVVGDILSAESFQDFTEKVIALERARRDLIALVARSSTLGELIVRVISHILRDAIHRSAVRLSPTSAIESAVERSVLPDLEARVEALLNRRVERHREQLAERLERHLLEALDADALRALVDELWQTLSKMRMAEAFAYVGEQDLEDFVVFCYEFWLRFRRTPYFRHVLREVVAGVFAKYGSESLAALIEDMGVSREMVATELKTLLAPVLEHATKTGFLEQQIRQHLGDFYESSPCVAALTAG
jgi:hypothetical protein